MALDLRINPNPDPEDEGEFVLDAYSDGQWVGHAKYDVWDEHRSVLVLQVSVDPAYRRRGIGRQMLQKLRSEYIGYEFSAEEFLGHGRELWDSVFGSASPLLTTGDWEVYRLLRDGGTLGDLRSLEGFDDEQLLQVLRRLQAEGMVDEQGRPVDRSQWKTSSDDREAFARDWADTLLQVRADEKPSGRQPGTPYGSDGQELGKIPAEVGFFQYEPDDPEVRDQLMRANSVGSDPLATPEEMDTPFTWADFSRARGYTDDEIATFQHMLDLKGDLAFRDLPMPPGYEDAGSFREILDEAKYDARLAQGRMVWDIQHGKTAGTARDLYETLRLSDADEGVSFWVLADASVEIVGEHWLYGDIDDLIDQGAVRAKVAAGGRWMLIECEALTEAQVNVLRQAAATAGVTHVEIASGPSPRYDYRSIDLPTGAGALGRELMGLVTAAHWEEGDALNHICSNCAEARRQGLPAAPECSTMNRCLVGLIADGYEPNEREQKRLPREASRVAIEDIRPGDQVLISQYGGPRWDVNEPGTWKTVKSGPFSMPQPHGEEDEDGNPELLWFVFFTDGTATAHQPDGMTYETRRAQKIAASVIDFDQIRKSSSEWCGADGGFPVDLPDGNTLWLFGDTFIGHMERTGALAPDWSIIHNSFVLQEGRRLTPIMGGEKGARVPIIPSDESGWYWPTAGCAAGDSVFIFCWRVQDLAGMEGGSFDFDTVGTSIAEFSAHERTFEFKGIHEFPGSDHDHPYGASASVIGDYLYAFGSDGGETYVARSDGPDGMWTYWNVSEWAEDSSEADPVKIVGEAPAGQLRVYERHDGLIAISKLGIGPEIGLWTASEPQGPWTFDRVVGRANVTSHQLTYDAFMVGNDDDSRLVYSANTIDSTEALHDVWSFGVRTAPVAHARVASVPDWLNPTPDEEKFPYGVYAKAWLTPEGEWIEVVGDHYDTAMQNGFGSTDYALDNGWCRWYIAKGGNYGHGELGVELGRNPTWAQRQALVESYAVVYPDDWWLKDAANGPRIYEQNHGKTIGEFMTAVDSLVKSPAMARIADVAQEEGYFYRCDDDISNEIDGQVMVHMGTLQAALDAVVLHKYPRLYRFRIQPQNPWNSPDNPVTDQIANNIWGYDKRTLKGVPERGWYPAKGMPAWSTAFDAVYYTNAFEDAGSLSIECRPSAWAEAEEYAVWDYTVPTPKGYTGPGWWRETHVPVDADYTAVQQEYTPVAEWQYAREDPPYGWRTETNTCVLQEGGFENRTISPFQKRQQWASNEDESYLAWVVPVGGGTGNWTWYVTSGNDSGQMLWQQAVDSGTAPNENEAKAAAEASLAKLPVTARKTAAIPDWLSGSDSDYSNAFGTTTKAWLSPTGEWIPAGAEHDEVAYQEGTTTKGMLKSGWVRWYYARGGNYGKGEFGVQAFRVTWEQRQALIEAFVALAPSVYFFMYADDEEAYEEGTNVSQLIATMDPMVVKPVPASRVDSTSKVWYDGAYVQALGRADDRGTCRRDRGRVRRGAGLGTHRARRHVGETSGPIVYLSAEQIAAINERVEGQGTISSSAVESAAARPMQSAFGEDAYPDLHTKAAALLHSLANNHAFVDGNKRTAWLAAIVFLRINGAVVTQDQYDDDFVVSVVEDHLPVESIAAYLQSKTGRVADVGTDPNDQVAFKDRLGRCYELAGQYVMSNMSAMLVHGSIEGFGNPRIGHAWALDEDGEVFEPTSGKWWPSQEAFDDFHSAEYDAIYGAEQMMVLMLKYGHWGPWDEEEQEQFPKTAGPGGGVIPERVRAQPFPDLYAPREIQIDPVAAADIRDLRGDEQKDVWHAIDAVADGKMELEPKQRGDLVGTYSADAGYSLRVLLYPHVDGDWHVFYVGDHDYDEAERRFQHWGKFALTTDDQFAVCEDAADADAWAAANIQTSPATWQTNIDDDYKMERSLWSTEYREMNEFLRSHGPGWQPTPITQHSDGPYYVYDTIDDYVSMADDVLGRSVTTSPVLAFRSLERKRSEWAQGLQVGDTFTDLGYTSTSLVDAGWDSKGNTFAEIEVPAGTHAYYNPSTDADTQELTLDRGLTFRVTDDRMDGDRRILRMQIVGGRTASEQERWAHELTWDQVETLNDQLAEHFEVDTPEIVQDDDYADEHTWGTYKDQVIGLVEFDDMTEPELYDILAHEWGHYLAELHGHSLEEAWHGEAWEQWAQRALEFLDPGATIDVGWDGDPTKKQSAVDPDIDWLTALEENYPKVDIFSSGVGGYFITPDGDAVNVRQHEDAVLNLTGSDNLVEFMRQTGCVRVRTTNHEITVGGNGSPLTDAQRHRIKDELDGTRTLVAYDIGGEGGHVDHAEPNDVGRLLRAAGLMDIERLQPGYVVDVHGQDKQIKNVVQMGQTFDPDTGDVIPWYFLQFTDGTLTHHAPAGTDFFVESVV